MKRIIKKVFTITVLITFVVVVKNMFDRKFKKLTQEDLNILQLKIEDLAKGNDI